MNKNLDQNINKRITQINIEWKRWNKILISFICKYECLPDK